MWLYLFCDLVTPVLSYFATHDTVMPLLSDVAIPLLRYVITSSLTELEMCLLSSFAIFLIYDLATQLLNGMTLLMLKDFL